MPWLMQGIRNILNDLPPELPKIPISLKLDQIITESGIEEAVRQYKIITDNQADQFDLSEWILNAYGYYLLGEDQVSNAIEILTLNTLSYPGSPNVYDSLGDAYEKNNQFDKAAKNYAKALEIEQSTQGEDISVYKSNLERVRGKLSNQ